MFSAVGTPVGQRHQVALAALQAGQGAAGLQLVGQRDDVDGLPALVQRQHRLEDLAVGGQEEVVGRQPGQQLVDGRRLDQHPAQRGPLGIQVLRRRSPGDPPRAGELAHAGSMDQKERDPSKGPLVQQASEVVSKAPRTTPS